MNLKGFCREGFVKVLFTSIVMIGFLAACGQGNKLNSITGSGNSASSTDPTAPVVTFMASTTSIAPGGSANLIWTSSNAVSCQATGAWTGSQMTSGSFSVSPSSTSSYGLTCMNANTSTSLTVTITVSAALPTVTLSANPTSIVSGSSTTLTWSTTKATTCVASGAWSGSEATSGNLMVSPTTTSTYTLTCTGTGGSTSSSAMVTVTAAVDTPSMVQYAVEQTNGASGVFEVNSIVTLKTATKGGDTLWVVGTIPNDLNGVGTLPGPISVVDCTPSNFNGTDCNGSADKFQQLGSDLIDNPNGEQSMAQFYATNITAGVKYVVMHWDNDNYKGVIAVEVGGVTSTSLVGSSGLMQNSGFTLNPNGIDSGNITVSAAQAPALLLAVSMDTFGGFSDTGGDDTGGPLYGTGFDDITYMWNWSPGDTCKGSIGCTTATFETKSISSAGTYSGQFTAQSSQGQYVTVSAVFH